jgi:hypothetical protein
MVLLLSDLSDAEILIRPVPQANHIAWQIGHLIVRERDLISSQRLGVPYPDLPDGFDFQHSDATAKRDPPSGFLSKAEYLDLFAQNHQVTMATLNGLSEADLDRSVIGDAGMKAPTLGDLFLITPSNIGIHHGQVSILRRKLGKPILF